MDNIKRVNGGLRELALFAGAGGGILGGILCGFRTVCAVEIDAYCRAVLCQRQNEGILPPFPIWDDVRTFDGQPWRGIIDVVSGGFPCQDISTANAKGKGLDGERSGLWSEMRRIIGEVRPRFVLVENSPNIVNKGGVRVVADLAALGYDCRWGVVGAHHAGAPHKRDRWWCLAYPHDMRELQPQGRVADIGGRLGDDGTNVADANEKRRESFRLSIGDGSTHTAVGGCGKAFPDADLSETARQRSKGGEVRTESAAAKFGGNNGMADTALAGDVWRERELGTVEARHGEYRGGAQDGRGEWWAVEPPLGRVANGVADRVGQLRALGNGQVPAVVRIVWDMLGGDW